MLASHAELLQALGWTLLHSLWQGLLIAGILFIINLFVKRSDVRYVLACAALILMLIVPLMTFGLLYKKPDTTSFANQTLLTADVPVDVKQINLSTKTNEMQTVPQVGQPHGVAPTEPFWDVDWRERLTHYLPYVVAVWLVGVIFLSLRLLLQWFYAERFKRRHTKLVSAELQQHLRVLALRLLVSRPVQLLESSLVDAPTVIGFLKPVILLPTSALIGLSVQQLESLLAHELAHIRRHDYLVNILQSVLETLLFYHPALWWVSQRIRLEREHCCDDVAVKVTGNPVVYAKALATLETLRSQPQLALAASDGKLVNRVKRILGVREKERRSFGWLAGGLVLVTVVAMNAFIGIPEGQAQQQENSEIHLTVVGNITVDADEKLLESGLDSGSLKVEGSLDKGSFAILEEAKDSQRQAVLFGSPTASFEGTLLRNVSLAIEATDSQQIEGSLSLEASNPFEMAYALNPTFSYDEGKAPSVKADEVTLIDGATLESNSAIEDEFTLDFGSAEIMKPWFANAAKKIGIKYLELADADLPLNGATGTLEDGTKYSILIVKNRDNFAQELATIEDKELRRQLLEQAFTYGVITDSEYQALLKTLSMNETELEQINSLQSDTEKLAAFLELAPKLPSSGSAYVAYLKAIAGLPSDMKQQTIKAFREVLNSRVEQPDLSTLPNFIDGSNINYGNSTLVVQSEDAIAIIDFYDAFVEQGTEDEQRRNGVAYRYRVLERGSQQEEYGEGIVFENFERKFVNGSSNIETTPASGGDMTYIHAGPIFFGWAYGSVYEGWVFADYLQPVLKSKESFETFDLKTLLSSTDAIELESDRAYEQPYLTLPQTPVVIEATQPDIQTTVWGEESREIPFAFDPKEAGIPEILEQPYKLRLTVQDALGERELLNRDIPAAESVEATLQIYGEATAQLFINDVLFTSWNP